MCLSQLSWILLAELWSSLRLHKQIQTKMQHKQQTSTHKPDKLQRTQSNTLRLHDSESSASRRRSPHTQRTDSADAKSDQQSRPQAKGNRNNSGGQKHRSKTKRQHHHQPKRDETARAEKPKPENGKPSSPMCERSRHTNRCTAHCSYKY